MGFTLEVYVQPGGSLTAVGGTFDGLLVVKVSSRPVEGAATEHVRQALADAFDLRPRQVALVRGATSRRKVFALEGDDAMLESRAEALRSA